MTEAAVRVFSGDEARVSAHGVEPAKQKKKLLYVAVCDPDLQVTGATVRMGAFVRHLSRFYDITLVNMTGSGYRVDPEVEERSRDRENRLSVTQRVLVEFSQPGYFIFSPALYREADRFLKSGSFEYLLADYGLAAVYGMMLARRHGVPLIYSSHNVEFQKYLEQSKTDIRRGLLAPYVRWAECRACRAAKLVVAISESDRTQYAKWVEPEKIEVIPQGFDADVWNPFYAPPPPSPPVVLFFGNFRLEHNRGAARHIIKEIVPTVTRMKSDVKFQLVGAEPPTDLQALNVEYPGFVDDLAPYLRRANLVIAPMPFGFGMSTKIVSALAFGKRVLATPEGAGAIPRGYPGLTVAPLDAFPQKIIELLATSQVLDAGGFEALCNDFAWPRLIARLYQRIEERCARPDLGNS
ncbi:MAG TPA: glycosyltransferase family 4 protein [Candidatus Binatia bacterium]|nr:glycosyltransferase family 4 protein [Candidatus Binatia bacterium]